MKSLNQFKEGYVSTADYKIDKRGRKIKKRRFKLGNGKKASFNMKTGEYEKNMKEAAMDVPLVPDPPVMLVIKRRAVRLYPDGTRVALYWSDKLKRYFSVPYGTNIINPIQAEEYVQELQETDEILLNDGNSITISEESKELLINTYYQLDEEHRELFWERLTESEESFNTIYEFCRLHFTE